MIFEKTGCDPVDRRYLCNVENQDRVENLLTLGACSYMTHTGAAFDRMPEKSGAHHPAHILVGRFCSFADGLNFIVGLNHTYKGTTSTYPFEDPDRMKKIASYGVETPQQFEVPENRRVTANSYQNIFGHDVWVGYGVTIMGGVKVGTGAIIGAYSVVAKDIPPYAIVVGNPARVVKYRFDAETIKNFLAVKWWNWSIEKILDNCPLMKDAEKFLATHYTPALEEIPEDNIGEQIVNLRAQGRKVYNFIADFGVEHPLWIRVVLGFCRSNFADAVLVIWLGKDSTEHDFKLLAEAVQIFDNGAAKNIIVAETQGGLNFSPYALRQGTHFITNREMTTLEALDYLWDTDVKIISALDDGIFDGEPPVEWQAL